MISVRTMDLGKWAQPTHIQEKQQLSKKAPVQAQAHPQRDTKVIIISVHSKIQKTRQTSSHLPHPHPFLQPQQQLSHQPSHHQLQPNSPKGKQKSLKNNPSQNLHQKNIKPSITTLFTQPPTTTHSPAQAPPPAPPLLKNNNKNPSKFPLLSPNASINSNPLTKSTGNLNSSSKK